MEQRGGVAEKLRGHEAKREGLKQRGERGRGSFGDSMEGLKAGGGR